MTDHAPLTAHDELYLRLKGAREKLAEAQALLPYPHREALGCAIREIDRVAAVHCPWSRFDEPEVPA